MSEYEEKSVELNTDLKETINEIENDILEVAELSGDEGVSTKNIQKPKKPRTEKQKEALIKAQEARKLKALKKKEMEKSYEEDSDFFKKLTPAQRKKLKDMALDKIPMAEGIEENKVYPSKPRGKKVREEVVYESDPSSGEEEVIVIKKRKPKKKKKQKVIYESASDSSDEDETIVKQIQKPKKQSVKYEPEFSDEEELDYYNTYQYKQQPLTYSSVARFL